MVDKVFSTSYTEKTTPADNDFVLLTDSADGDKVKKGRYINFKGAKGNTGASITSASIVGDDIVFTKDDTTTVTLTGAVTSLKGEDGREIELQVSATHIQWRYTGDVSWTNLIALSELKGADGACLVSVSFVGDDMVFVLDDASTVSLVGAKTTLKGADGISFTPKGEYSAGTSYVANDVVSYLGSSWIALQSTTGNTPAEGTYWTLNAAKGADGLGSGDMLKAVYDPANGAKQVAFDDEKQDNLVSGTNIKTINGNTILGSGDLEISAGSGGYAANVYLTNDTSTTVGTYKQLSYTLPATEVVKTISCISGSDGTGDVYIFDLPLGVTTIDAGIWSANFFGKVDNTTTGDTKLRVDTYVRTTGGTETLLFSVTSNAINSTTTYDIATQSGQSVFTVNSTDKLVSKVFATTTSNTTRTVTYYVGDGNASYINTPLALRHDQLRGRDASDSHPASAITNTPSGNISSTTVQWALNELDTEKVPTSRTITINGTAQDLSADRSWTISAGGTYWTAVPGSPTRTGNTTFTLTDTSNTNKYDLLISRGTVVKWTESSTVKQAMVVSSTYATNTVTVTLVGDTMASIDASSLKYGAVKAKELTFAYLPTVGTGTDIMGRWYAGEKTKVHGAIAYHGTAGTTNATTYDCNKNGTTFMTTKISVSSGSTVSSDYTSDNGTYLDTNNYITIDCDSVSTTAPVYATIKVFVSPWNDIYLA